MTKNAAARHARPASPDDLGTASPPGASMIVVGKDVLELLSSAMYVDPLSIYREYVQNAADAIDDARETGILDRDAVGSVSITVDPQARRFVIRDNGAGIPVDQAGQRLLAIGASAKRGTRARGFRGVGRLAGLAYGRTLTFRTRADGDARVLQVRWDCQRLKAALRDVAESNDIGSVIQRVVSLTFLDGEAWPEHFFEVELTDIIRTRRDALLSPQQISHYLEQVAPIPFDDSFSWSGAIAAHLDGLRLGNLDIRINDQAPLRRPLTDRFKVTDAISDDFGELELITIQDLDGGTAARGWILHHGYRGSISVRSRIGGLRVRVGNVQVGDESLLADVFTEARFNGWTVGEIHVVDPRILPNARRDHFEQNVHFSNLTAQLEPVGRQISKRARSASIARNNARLSKDAIAPTLVDEVATAAPSADHEPLRQPAAMQTSAPSGAVTGAGLSVRQKATLRKLRSVLKLSGLSPKERGELALVLQQDARTSRDG